MSDHTPNDQSLEEKPDNGEFFRTFLISLIAWPAIREVTFSIRISILNFFSQAYNLAGSLRTFIWDVAMPTFIWQLLSDFETIKKKVVCAVLWKAFMATAIGLGYHSYYVAKLAAKVGGKVSALVCILAVLVTIMVILNRFYFWDTFIQEQKVKLKKWWRVDPFYRCFIVYPRDILKRLLVITLVTFSTILGVYGEEKDLFGDFAMVCLTLSLLSYEVKIKEYDDLGLSDAFLGLQASLWAGPYKHTYWLPFFVFTSVFVIVFFKWFADPSDDKSDDPTVSSENLSSSGEGQVYNQERPKKELDVDDQV